MDDDRRFLYAQLSAFALVGVAIWLAFAHWWLLESIALAILATVVLFLRYRGLTEWSHIKHRGNPREIRDFKIFVVLFFLLILGLALALHWSQRH